MITQPQYLNFVIRPQELTGQDSEILYNLTDQFPYCQTSRLLYLLSLLNENSIQFSGMLKVVAAYSSDRKMLKELIERFSKPRELADKKSVLENVLNEGLKEPQISKISDVFIDEEKVQNVDEILYINTKNENLLIELVDTSEKTNEPVLLNSLENEKTALEGEDQTTTTSEHSIPRKSKTEIIDQFIEKAPRITRSRTDFFNPVDYARNSTIDKEDIVSETLASIYYEQGNIEKAIKIYEKLSLRYPEKSSYFAALIKKIKVDNNLNT